MENIAAAELVLSTDERSGIERAAAKITVQGARYPEHLERMTSR
jgi:hypothetical protein